MKKLLLILGFTGLQAGILDVAPSTVFKGPQAYQDTGIGFELINKSKRPIWIAITSGGDTSRVAKIEPATKMMRHEVRYNIKDINQRVKLAVWYTDPGQITFEKKFSGFIGEQLFKPTPNKVYTFTPGKTLYLTWDKANYARPQSGPLGGRLHKTDSNLSLKDNVKKEDIKEHAQKLAS